MSEFWAAVAGAAVGGLFAVVAAVATMLLSFRHERRAAVDEKLDVALWRAQALVPRLLAHFVREGMANEIAATLYADLTACMGEVGARSAGTHPELNAVVHDLLQSLGDIAAEAALTGRSAGPVGQEPLLTHLNALGMAIAAWTHDSRDFSRQRPTAAAFLKLARNAEPDDPARAVQKPSVGRHEAQPPPDALNTG